MLESKGSILVIAGLFFFALAFVSNALVPAMMYRDLPEKTAEQLVTANLRYQFEDLARRFPESFEKHVGKAPEDAAARETWLNEKAAEALRIGRKVYVGEACWHCHSQFVRPVSNESRRWGPVSQSWEYQNELQRPVMFGTRRVGPDLSREGGRRSNDWQAVHLFQPTLLSDGSVMPEYPWFFDGSPDKPNRRGLALLTYLQWLGSWLESYPYYEEYNASPLPKEAVPGPVEADAAAVNAAASETVADGAAAEPGDAEPEGDAAGPAGASESEPPTDAKPEEKAPQGAAKIDATGTEPPAAATTETASGGTDSPPSTHGPPAVAPSEERPTPPAAPQSTRRVWHQQFIQGIA